MSKPQRTKEELEVEKLEREIDQLSKFQLKDFLSYILPSFLQLIAILGTILILYFTNVFDVNSKLSEINKKQLEMDSKELQNRKDSLNKTIDSLHNTIGSYRDTISNYREEKQQLDQVLLNKNNDWLKLNSSFIPKFFSNYLNGNYEIDDREVDFYISSAKSINNENSVIRNELAKNLAATNIDSNIQLENKILLNCFGYFCFYDSEFKKGFTENMKRYLTNNKGKGKSYKKRIINLMVSKRWNDVEVNSNLSLLWAYADSSKDAAKIEGVIEMVINVSVKNLLASNDKTYDVIPAVNEILLNKTLCLLDTSKKIKTLQESKDLKRSLLYLLAECPQCYFSIEAKAINNDIEKYTKDYARAESNAMGFFGNGSELLFYHTLLRPKDVKDYSEDLFSLYNRFLNNNDIPTFEDKIKFPSKDKTNDKFISAFNEYYLKNSTAFIFWIENVKKDRNRPSTCKRIAELRF